MPHKRKTTFTTIPVTDRGKKNLLFLNLIKKQKSTSRTEISKVTDINIVTVSNYVNSYLKKGFLLERGYDISSGGRRPELIELNKGWGYVAGLDINEAGVKGSLSDVTMETIAHGSFDSGQKKNAKASLHDMFEQLIGSAKRERSQVKKIGIALSALSEKLKTEVIRARDTLEQELKIPVLLGDGALCAAFGEKNAVPDAREASRALYIYRDIGQGVFVKNGEFYEASDEKDEYTYLRPWSAGFGVVGEAKRIIERGMGTTIIDKAGGDARNITAGTVIRAAGEQDEIAVDLVKMAGMNLGVRIAYLVNLFEPEIVIVGGGIEEAGHFFMDPLKTSVNRFILQRMLNKVKISPAILGRDACVRGAACLAVREVFLEA
jgi:predicted NBD/HSP70 family sugar kinase